MLNYKPEENTSKTIFHLRKVKISDELHLFLFSKNFIVNGKFQHF